MNQFGDRIKLLREQKGLLQRQVANQLDMDTPMLSKIERGERNAKREQVIVLCKIFEVEQHDLISLWLADKLYELVKNEKSALKAIELTSNELKKGRKSK